MQTKHDFVLSLAEELRLRANYLDSPILSSIYFGGGTPSLLTREELLFLFNEIRKHFEIDPDAEITLEANPDDLDLTWLKGLSSTPVNRLSIGIQSFFDEDLAWMNRVHNANLAETAIRNAQEAGFKDLSIDLIYGVPGLDDSRWETNLHKAIDLNINHISAYCLTVEQRTALKRMIENGKVKAPDEEQGARQFAILTELLQAHDFEQYEISNFARNGKYAIHNSNYWKGDHYLGLGPSAHSFNGKTRSWNIANNNGYIKAIGAGELSLETEVLSPENQFNERLMTGLRTMWGVNLSQLKVEFPTLFALVENAIERKQKEGFLLIEGDYMTLSQDGKFLADGIASDLFVG